MTPEGAVDDLLSSLLMHQRTGQHSWREAYLSARARVLSMMRREPFGRCPKPAECVAMSTSTKDGWTSECQSCGWKVVNGVPQDPADTAASALADVQEIREQRREPQEKTACDDLSDTTESGTISMVQIRQSEDGFEERLVDSLDELASAVLELCDRVAALEGKS